MTSGNQKLRSVLDRYRNACNGYGEHLDRGGDAKVANLYFDEMTKAYRELVRYGEEGISALLSLLHDSSIYVRFSAAFEGLQFSPEESEKALDEVVSTGGIIGFTVMIGLERWRSGEFTFHMLNEDRCGTLEETKRERESLGIRYPE